MSQRHNRSGSHGRKALPSYARPLTRRGNSYNQAVPHSHSHTSSQGKFTSKKQDSTESDEDSMAGFLQFCANCEKQIVGPGQILYCSEACRKQDVSGQSTFASAIPSPPLTPSTLFDNHGKYFDILPQRSPTVLRPLSQTFADFSLSDHTPLSNTLPPERDHRRESETTHSLAQFYSDLSRRQSAPRPSGDSQANVPSLSHSPSSSYSTIASNASYQRPLMPRHNPYASSFSTKSIDLVLPYPIITTPSSPTHVLKDASVKSSASTLTSFRVAEADRVPSGSRRSPSEEAGCRADRSLRGLYGRNGLGTSPKTN